MHTHTGRGYTIKLSNDECTEWQDFKCDIKSSSTLPFSIVGTGISKRGEQLYYSLITSFYKDHTFYLAKTNYTYNSVTNTPIYKNAIVYKIVNYNLVFMTFDIISNSVQNGIVKGQLMFHKRFSYNI